MFRYIFREYNKACKDDKLYKGYRLLAVDGSDVNIAYNPDGETYMPNGDNNKGFNQFHLNFVLQQQKRIKSSLQKARLNGSVANQNSVNTRNLPIGIMNLHSL